MAQRVVTQLLSDLPSDELAAGEGETIAFTYRGVGYTIDLTEKEAAGFDKSVAAYIEHATKVGGRRRSSSSAASSDCRAKDVRVWAKESGIEVPDRGTSPMRFW